MNQPMPLHRMTCTAQAQVLRALHRARRGGPLYATMTFGFSTFHFWWGGPSLTPDALWEEGKAPQGRVCPWPRRPSPGLNATFPGALTEDGVDYEAIAWAYEQDDAWWKREGWREVGDARA